MDSTPNKHESIGRYTIIRELGRGGMSVVYLALDTQLGREVAIKCVDTSDATTARLADGLRAEATLLAQLNHPNIVQLYDVVEQGNTLGLVIEYAGGETLAQRLQQQPSPELTLKWLAELSEGIASAHQRGIAHCDIKAENILITVDNIAKVADFGIAKLKLSTYLEDDGLTRMDSVSGSYFSLSPEQATGQAVDTRTDIFSMAVLIHQALLAKHPFGKTNNKVALVTRVINDPFELSPSSVDILGARLAGLLKNCMNKRPAERLYSASEMAELLRHEMLSSANDVQTDQTVTFAGFEPKIKSRERLLTNLGGVFPKTALAIIGAILIFVFLTWLSSPDPVNEDINYIALDNINVTASDDFNSDLLALLKSTLQQSAENAILSFKRTGLVEAKELNAAGGHFSEKAAAAGVNNILVVTANCLQQKCDIKIQHRSGERMAVTRQTNFPVASNSLVGLKRAISSQIPKLFNQSEISGRGRDLSLSESDYRRYLDIYIKSNSGLSSDQTHFEDIQSFINVSPNFLPSYHLLYRLGSYLSRNTGDKKYPLEVQSILKESPLSVQNDRDIKRINISTSLDLGQLDEAKALYASLMAEVDDKQFLSKIESSIAYAEDDYEKLLLLDRQNAIWRPSVNNLYNLATSEFFIGNHVKSKEIIEKVLLLSPQDSYALDLNASIEMSLGNLPLAIKTYEALLSNSQDSNVYSNYALALMLSKEYDQAIEASKKAIEIDPNDSMFHLNLADSYALSGQLELARLNYNRVILLLKDPKTVNNYSVLAQSLAHLGEYQKAVRILKSANKKFPNIAELNYAASIVNTLSGNHVAAIVDMSDAIDAGTAPVWFSFEWFKALCGYSDFQRTIGAVANNVCQ